MGRHKVKGKPSISLSCEYGGHDIYSGKYNTSYGKTIIWTQAGDDCEGNQNGNPAVNIDITTKLIKLETDDGFKRTWVVPEYKYELQEIEEEIEEELEKYYSQYIRQPMFIKKEK